MVLILCDPAVSEEGPAILLSSLTALRETVGGLAHVPLSFDSFAHEAARVILTQVINTTTTKNNSNNDNNLLGKNNTFPASGGDTDVVSAYLHRKDINPIEATESLALKITAGLSQEVAMDIIHRFTHTVVNTRTHENIEASRASLEIVKILTKYFPGTATVHAVDLLRTRLTICEISMLVESTKSTFNLLAICYTPHYTSFPTCSSSFSTPTSSTISTYDSINNNNHSTNFLTFDLGIAGGGENGRIALIQHVIDTIKTTTEGGGGDGTTPTSFSTTTMADKRQIIRWIRSLLRDWGMSRTGGWQQAIELDCIPIPSLLGVSSVTSHTNNDHHDDIESHVSVWADVHELCMFFALYDEMMETLIIDLPRMSISSSVMYAKIIDSIQNMVNGTVAGSIPALISCQVSIMSKRTYEHNRLESFRPYHLHHFNSCPLCCLLYFRLFIVIFVGYLVCNP